MLVCFLKETPLQRIKETPTEREKCGVKFRESFQEMRKETRVWMSIIGNFIAIGLFVNVPLYVSALYYEQNR